MLNVAVYIVSDTSDAYFIIIIKYVPWACPELPDRCLPTIIQKLPSCKTIGVWVNPSKKQQGLPVFTHLCAWMWLDRSNF